jgi:hypothetical protein
LFYLNKNKSGRVYKIVLFNKFMDNMMHDDDDDAQKEKNREIY